MTSVRKRIAMGPIALMLLAAAACASEPAADEAEAPPAAQDPASLVGSWRVTSVVFDGGEDVTPVPDAAPTLDFTDEADPTGSRAFGGTGGCNRIRGTYDAGTTGRISFGPAASTMMACPEAVMRVEQMLLSALETAARYTVDGDRLRITFEGGTLHLERA